MADVLKRTFDVVVGGITYTFRVPTIRFDVEVGYKAHDVRRRAYPEGQGALFAADQAALRFSQCVAYMELYLTASTDQWPYSTDKTGKPVVDFEKFPDDKAETLYEVGAGFEEEYARFRKGGDLNKSSSEQEAVAG